MSAISPRAPGARTRAAVSPSAVLAIVAMAQFMVILDASVVNVALPSIKVDLGFSQSSLSWVLNAYTLVFGGFLMLGGRLADRLGRRAVFVAGLSLFSAASLLCGLAQSEAMLLGARGLQGLGGALVSPAALSIVIATFAEGAERNRALAVWGAIAGAGGAVGLLLGGIIVQVLSWRWVFFVNVPIGALVVVLAPRIVPESRSSTVGTGYDVEGAAAITIGTMALVFTLIKANDWGWTSPRTLAGFAVALVLLAAFVWIEGHHDDPLVPLRIFRNRSLAAANAAMLAVAAALFAMFFFLSLYLQQVLGYSALKTGVAYLPLSLGIIIVSGLASQLVDRVGATRVLVAGLVVATAGFLLLTRVEANGTYAGDVLAPMVVLAIGLGASFVPITIAATNGVDPEDAGLASGLLNTTQQVGGSLGLAILSAVASSRTADALKAGDPGPVALTHGFAGAFAIGAVLCGLGALIALVFLRDVRTQGPEPVAAPAPPARAAQARAPSAAPAPAPAHVVAASISRCPGAPNCGWLVRLAAAARRVRARAMPGRA